MFNREDVLKIYNEQMRKDAFVPGLKTQRLRDVTRYIDPLKLQGMIMWHQFTLADAPRVIARELEFFSPVSEFVWKVYAEDEPEELPEMLERAGLKAGRMDTVMFCEVAKAMHLAGPVAAGEARVRRILDPKQVEGLRSVWEAVWPGESSGWVSILAEELVRSPELLQVLVCYDGDQPVSTGYVVLDPRREFAYFGGGATLPSHRGQGLYREMVVERARIAQTKGYQYLAVEASPDSMPSLARLGFDALTELRFYKRTKRADDTITMKRGDERASWRTVRPSQRITKRMAAVKKPEKK